MAKKAETAVQAATVSAAGAVNTANLKQVYLEQIVPTLTKEFSYTSKMQVPVLKKIVINQGLGAAVADKKIVDVAVTELTAITGQKAVVTISKKDISNFKLRRKMPIGAMVTLRREQMYEFLERLVRVALPRIRDFKGVESKLDGKGNYTLGITEQIIFPEINIDEINKILGMNITFVTSAKTDEEGYALLREFGLPFKNAKKVQENG
ncbi:50S ribosomal protein L5 [Bacteroidia bacterium]|nr:50S ribosomal protein L5 [Bacteroidia bacterium]